MRTTPSAAATRRPCHANARKPNPVTPCPFKSSNSLCNLVKCRTPRATALALDAEITVRIVGEDEGRALNLSYRKKDYATNVLTFDYTQEPVVVADLVLCAPVVAREAKEQGKTLQAHYAHLLVHGTLHAQGWDHETSTQDAQEMEAYEIDILAELGLPNPY